MSSSRAADDVDVDVDVDHDADVDVDAETGVDLEAAAALDERDWRALGEYISVLADHGRARDAPGLYYVVGAAGSSYLVDVETQSCECPDASYRDPDDGCKHVRRVQFATGAREIPAGVDPRGDLTVHGSSSSDTQTASASATATATASETETETETETDHDHE